MVDDYFKRIPNVIHVLHFFLFVTMLISLYIFILAIGMKSSSHRPYYFAWQFPMLLAIFLESYFMF